MEALAPIFAAIGSFASSAAPFIAPAMSLIGGLTGGGGGTSTPTPAAPKTPAASTITGTAVAPGTSPTDFTKEQTAWWQQMLQGTGQGTPGGALPGDLSSMIEKQASLIGG